MKKIFILVLGFAIYNSSISSALSLENLKNKMHGYNFSFLLPIDVSKKEGMRTNLKLTIPAEFRCLQQDKLLNDSTPPNTLEFIPQNDDQHNWSKIITSTAYVGKSIKTKDLIALMKDNFIQNSTNLEILEENISQTNSIETGVLLVVYTHNDRRELVGIKSFSGPFDCALVQYAIAIKKDETENDVAKEIKSWMKDTSNLKLINF